LGRVAEEGVYLGRTEIAGVDADNDIPWANAPRAAPLGAGAVGIDRLDDPGLLYPLPFSAQADPQHLGCGLDEAAHRVLLPGSDDEILPLIELQHQPLRLDVVAGVAPVAQGVEVP